MNGIDSSRRIASIDALRGLAAAMVMLSHLMPTAQALPAWAPVTDIVLWLFQYGQTGVLLFFLISGYVIPSSLVAHSDAHLRRFLVSRVARIYPAYWMSMILAVLLAPAVVPVSQIAVNLTLGQRFVGVEDLIGVYWTLQVELVFYVLVAGLFVAGVLKRPDRLGMLVAGAALFLVAAALARHFLGLGLPVGTGVYLLLMMFGAWLRLAAPPLPTQWTAALGLATALAVIAWALYYPQAYHRSWLSHLSGFLIALFVFVAWRRCERLGWRPLVWLGDISYSVYLLHMLAPFAVDFLWPGAKADPGLRFIASVALSLATATLIYQLIEQPAIRLGRKFAQSWAAAGATGTSGKAVQESGKQS